MAHGDSGKHKLTHHEQLLIKQWLAEDRAYAEINNLLTEFSQKTLSLRVISYYAHFYKTEIQAIREKINASVLNIPIANKEVRLRRREDIYKIYFKKGEYEKAREVLNEAAKEMEVKVPLIGGIGIQVNGQQNDREVIEAIPQDQLEKVDDFLETIIEQSNAKQLITVEPSVPVNQGSAV